MRVLCFILFWIPILLNGQAYDQTYFKSPVKYDMVLAGSFAELRNNHFHAGIDIKPSNPQAIDSIFVSAEGFVSRIKVERGGYGRAVYVDHPNGYTTVYAHLNRFNDTIREYISNLQKQAQSYEVDIYPKKGSLLLEQGAYIGILGNAGRSYGPHLHYEIRETASEIPVNPFLFGLKPKDTRAPILMSYSVYGLQKNFKQDHMETVYLSKDAKGNYGPSKTVTVPSWRAGVAIQCYDLMNGAGNHNGIYSIETFVDDTLIHRIKMDKVGFHESKFIRSYTDYQQREKYKRWAVRCFRHPGNILSVYDSLLNEGIFPIYKNVPRQIKINVTDLDGNISTISFNVLRGEPGKQSSETFNMLVPFDVDTTFINSEAFIEFPKGSIDKDMYFSYHSDTLNNGQVVHHLGSKYDPVFKFIKMGLRPNRMKDTLIQKAVIVQAGEKNNTSFGGIFDGHYLTAYTDKIGPFTIELDTIPPVITPQIYTAIITDPDKLTFTVKDNFEVRGNARDLRYHVWIDGVWTVCPFKSLTDLLSIPVDNLNTGDHELLIEVTDDKENKSTFRSTFTIVN